MSQARVIDQTAYEDFIEYVIRIDEDDSLDFRVQADGTLVDLETKITEKIQELTAPAAKSEVETGTIITVNTNGLQTNHRL